MNRQWPFFSVIYVKFDMIFGWADFSYNEGAKLVMEKAQKILFKDDWKKIFSLESIKQTVKEITGTIGNNG